MKQGKFGLILVSAASLSLFMPVAALAKDVCLKEQGSQRYLKISGLKNLKKPGKVAPLYGY